MFIDNQENLKFILGRDSNLFSKDLNKYEKEIKEIIECSKFLIIGGAGSIGSSLTIEIFKRNPKLLHVVDISENNTAELVRNIRSSFGYIKGDFQTFAIDCSSKEFNFMINQNSSYDYIFNLSALKHVRSESDPYTLMRMTEVNILNNLKILELSKIQGIKKYFSVSSDKATNPVNLMGASKKIMEMFLFSKAESINISSARFANVAFSDGSLLHSFYNRLYKRQPLSAPNDISRYFMTSKESGELCLLSGIIGKNYEIFFPKLDKLKNLKSFSDIAIKFLSYHGYEPHFCNSEDEARNNISDLIIKKKWPCYFFKSDTTGEKETEEFYSNKENINFKSFDKIGIIKNQQTYNSEKLKNFLSDLENLRNENNWTKKEIIKLYLYLLPDLNYQDIGKYLDEKM